MSKISKLFTAYYTEDIQYDLAMTIADGSDNQALRDELIIREADIPVNCRWEFSSFTFGRRKLKYDLKPPSPNRTD